MKRLILISFFFFCYSAFAQNLSTEEKELYTLLMKYRKEKGLPSIPVSPSLTYVAQTHADDLQSFYTGSGKCNLHSWSSHGKWTSCCYTDDHKNAPCMWDKPRELTSYKGDGYEIAYWNSQGIIPEKALQGWKKSKGHHAMIVNQGMWSDSRWRAIGIGIKGNFAVVWFGEEADK